MTDRYKIVSGSQSAHCCFGFTVVDTHQRVIIGGKPWSTSSGEPEYEPMCECFDDEAAELICKALNGNVT